MSAFRPNYNQCREALRLEAARIIAAARGKPVAPDRRSEIEKDYDEERNYGWSLDLGGRE